MVESIMANLLLRLLPLLCLFWLVHSEDDLGCPISNCSSDGPLIKFPFRLKGDPPHCGDAQFELACLNNSAAIHLSPSSGLFLIKTIDYNAQQFRVYDADGCLPKRLVNFSFPTFPFYQVQKTEPQSCPFYNLTLLNCSTEQDLRSKVSVDYFPVNCLSVPGHQVLATPPLTSMAQLPVPSCTTLIAEISFPVIGGQSVESGSFVCEPDKALWLQYSWKQLPECQKCRDVDGGRCKLNRKRNKMKCSIHPHRGSMIIGVSIACVVLISVSAVLAIVFRSKYSNWREEKENQMKIEMFLKDHQSHVPTRYSYAGIKKMAKGFKKKLGEGNYGTVFEGHLPNGYSVAIKVLNDSKGNGEDFVNEVGTIGRIHHVNVVRLLGFSADQGCKRALIYELMPNKSLEKFISSEESNSTSSLDWKTLHHVITGVAKGIEYLHQGCDQRILHFDIKPHNILLDNDFNPKISDFGLAKLCPKDECVISMAITRGTEGYIAPEVRARNFGNVSYKSDVYSFGMLALDMIEARKEAEAVPTSTNNEVTHFPDWIYNRLIQEKTLGLQLDTEGDSDQIAKKLVIVALWCIQWYPVNRPSMKAVVRMLEGPFESLIMPPNPFASAS